MVRKFALPVVVIAVLAAAAWWWLGRRAGERFVPAGPVPVLVLGIDTLRGDHVGGAGPDAPRTPAIDALAADGTYFARCQTTAPWTGPSFASLYTGLLPYHHGFYNRESYALGPEQTTVAEILSAAGYRTGAAVTSGYLTAWYGMDQGFQELLKFTDQGRGEEAWLVTRAGADFTAAADPRPFFLFLHYYDVHAPYTPPVPFDRMYYGSGDPFAPDRPPLMDTLLDPEANLLARFPDIYGWLEGVTDPAYPDAQYDAGVSYADMHVGRVVEYLKDRNLYDRMLIVLVADHGEHMTEHGIYYGHAMPYEEVLHVPLIIKWPGGRQAGTVVRERVSIMDVLPTLLETLGLDVPAGLDGVSLAGLDDLGRSLLVAEQGERPDRYCKTVTEGDWKLLLFHRDGEFRPELYHLGDDPQELRNVAADHPDVVDRLTERIWRIFDPAEPLRQDRTPTESPLTAEERRRLKALGYVH